MCLRKLLQCNCCSGYFWTLINWIVTRLNTCVLHCFLLFLLTIIRGKFLFTLICCLKIAVQSVSFQYPQTCLNHNAYRLPFQGIDPTFIQWRLHFCVFLRSVPCCFGSWSFAMYKGLSMLIVESATHLGQLEYYFFILKEQFLFVCISSIREQMSQEHFYCSYVFVEWCICTRV